MNGQTITLNEGINGPTAGKELLITDSLSIDASMLTNGITISGTGGLDGVVGNGDGTSVFRINLTGVDDVALKGLRITGGDVDGNGGGVYSIAA